MYFHCSSHPAISGEKEYKKHEIEKMVHSYNRRNVGRRGRGEASQVVNNVKRRRRRGSKHDVCYDQLVWRTLATWGGGGGGGGGGANSTKLPLSLVVLLRRLVGSGTNMTNDNDIYWLGPLRSFCSSKHLISKRYSRNTIIIHTNILTPNSTKQFVCW